VITFREYCRAKAKEARDRGTPPATDGTQVYFIKEDFHDFMMNKRDRAFEGFDDDQVDI
jgi:hypothetical protein